MPLVRGSEAHPSNPTAARKFLPAPLPRCPCRLTVASIPRTVIRLSGEADMSVRWLAVVVALALGGARALGQDIPKMKFNEVREVAPGVFFRYSSISATDKSIPFGGSNNIWI